MKAALLVIAAASRMAVVPNPPFNACVYDALYTDYDALTTKQNECEANEKGCIFQPVSSNESVPIRDFDKVFYHIVTCSDYILSATYDSSCTSWTNKTATDTFLCEFECLAQSCEYTVAIQFGEVANTTNQPAWWDEIIKPCQTCVHPTTRPAATTPVQTLGHTSKAEQWIKLNKRKRHIGQTIVGTLAGAMVFAVAVRIIQSAKKRSHIML